MKNRINRSYTYLVPLVTFGVDFNRDAIKESYLFYKEAPELNAGDNIEGIFLHLLYEYESKETFKWQKRCKYMIDVDDKTFLVFLQAPTLFEGDIQYITEGKYSLIQSYAKKAIKEYHDIKANHRVVQILERSPELRKKLMEEVDEFIPTHAELGSVFDFQTEFFNKKTKENNKLDKVMENE